VIELKLGALDQVQQAFDLVRETSSAQGAVLVAEYSSKKKDFRGAIEFSIIAYKIDEAFNIAQSEGLMDIFTQFLAEKMTTEMALKVATYYEKMQEYAKAAK
jgi:WD repeat-containing protein 19